jgi:antirestriction protein ArdC
MVTDKVMEELKNGRIPWQKPWRQVGRAPINYVSRKPYSFLNSLLLRDGEYLTFKQCKALGGSIRKGAHASFVVFYTDVVKEQEKDGKKEKVTFPCLKYYNVFHVDDCDGIESKLEKVELNDSLQPIERAENVIKDYLTREPNLTFHSEDTSDRAFYRLGTDEVVVPNLNQFQEPSEYYSTAFHEFTHSTAHPSRCNRELGKFAAFGSKVYSREELVAEMGAAMLCSQTGIEIEKTFKNSVAYIQSWLQSLRNDEKMVVWAASKAEKAVKYILGMKEERE